MSQDTFNISSNLYLTMIHESLKDLPDLWDEARGLVRQIPRGKVATYGDVAEALGDRKASRFVWLALNPSVDSTDLPWHRVIRSDGKIGSVKDGDSLLQKAEALRGEGISVREGQVSAFKELTFNDFESSDPLKRLRARQTRLRESLRIPKSDVRFSKVAAADVSYEGDLAFASIVILDYESGEIVGEHLQTSRAQFPYISSYLSFRELPIISSIAECLDHETVLMYDGNGILHPNGFGIACHAGLIFDVPTIGVAKKLLCGQLLTGESVAVSKVILHGEVVGYAVSENNRKPIYVSPGHGISRSQSLCIVRRFLRSRIPEPLKLAHQKANDLRRSAAT